MKYIVHVSSPFVSGYIQPNTGLGKKETAHQYENQMVAKATGSLMAASLRVGKGQIKINASYRVYKVKE